MCRATPEGVEQSNYSGFHTAALVSKQLRLQCRTHLNNVRKQRATRDEFRSIFSEQKKHPPATADCTAVLPKHKRKDKVAFVVPE